MQTAIDISNISPAGPEAHEKRGTMAPVTEFAATGATPLVKQLCRLLDESRISYCHWKSNEAIGRSESAANDLDLLVCRSHADKFHELLGRLGFKQARTMAAKELPSITHYFGYDAEAKVFVHIHAHCQLLVGHDTTKNYRIPVEQAYIESAIKGDHFFIPRPEFELVLLVIRLTLKHSTWDSMVFLEGRISNSELAELEFLMNRSIPARVAAILSTHLPFLPNAVYRDCLNALQPRSSVVARLIAARKLQSALAGQGRRRPLVDLSLRVARRVLWGSRRYILRLRTKRQLISGGYLIAFVGGDGSGKSTAVGETKEWLSKYFELSTVHLGKPTPSATSVLIKGVLFVLRSIGLCRFHRPTPDEIRAGECAQFPGVCWLIWQVLTARDRFLTYRKARSRTSNGKIVVSDRYPLTEIRTMDGVRAGRLAIHRRSWITKSLLDIEARYYERIRRPDVVFVLKVNPETAVGRRHDEGEVFVRVRNTEIWDCNEWGKDTVVIDADQGLDQVQAEIKSRLWSRL